VALVALRTPNLVQVQVKQDLVVMGMLARRRDELGRARTQVTGRLHRLLLELLPGGAKKFLPARQARSMITPVRPRDLAGKTRRRLSRAGNRRINRVLHITAVGQLRNQTRGRAYLDERRAGEMPSMMAMPALKRRLSNIVSARMPADQKRREAGPGRQPGTPTDSTVAGPGPRTPAPRTSHIPDPPLPQPQHSPKGGPDIKGCHERASAFGLASGLTQIIRFGMIPGSYLDD
jgi:hypothetical protein